MFIFYCFDLPGEINIQTSTSVHFISLLMETAAGSGVLYTCSEVFSQLWPVF